MTVHVGDQKSNEDAIEQRKEKIAPNNIFLSNEKCIHFTEQFKYLGSLISLELNEDAEIAFRINKAKSLMEFSFFNCQDVDLRTNTTYMYPAPKMDCYEDMKHGICQQKTEKTGSIPPWSS
jgi:hypothetical protein